MSDRAMRVFSMGSWNGRDAPMNVRIVRARSFSYDNRRRADALASKMAKEHEWPFVVSITGATGRSVHTVHYPDGRVQTFVS